MIKLPLDKQLESLCEKQYGHNGVLVGDAPEWLIICGLGAGGGEARTSRKRWPGTRIVGIDFDPRVIASCKPGWRTDDLLLQLAVSDQVGAASASLAEPSCSTLHPQMVEKASKVDRVETVTLDCLDSRHGPFDRAVLWIDAEGSDCKIVAGATGLLRRGAILAVVIEVWTARPDLVKEYTKARVLLASVGFHLVEVLNPEWWGHNEIYLCDGLAEKLMRAG